MTISEELMLKKASEHEVNLLFKWINDPVVRAQSLSVEKISYEDHSKWFSKKITDSNCHFYIAYLNDLPVGMIRFDVNCDTSTINYLIDQTQRGKGIGTAIVENGLKKFFHDTVFKGKIFAVVKTSNPASIKIFERLGFERESADENLIYFKKHFHD